jgi:hypothetical protein
MFAVTRQGHVIDVGVDFYLIQTQKASPAMFVSDRDVPQRQDTKRKLFWSGHTSTPHNRCQKLEIIHSAHLPSFNMGLMCYLIDVVSV